MTNYTLGVQNASKYVNDDVAKEYVMKLIPDLGVFDLAEKYFIDNDISDGDTAAYFYMSTPNSGSVTHFTRFMVKTDGKITLESNIDTTKIPVYTFEIYDTNYAVFFNLNADSLNIQASNGSYLIGVRF